MAFEQKDNSGSIFKNRKPKNEKSPPLTGNAMVGGVEYWVSAWTKTDKNGEKWISFSFQAKNPSSEQVRHRPVAEVLDDDIPFD